MALEVQFTLDTEKLTRFGNQLERELQRVDANGKGPMSQSLNQAAHVYMAFIRQRFDTASKNGGAWRALALSTILRRKKAKNTRASRVAQSLAIDTQNRFGRGAGALVGAGRLVSILRDTGTLFNSIGPSTYQKDSIPAGIRVGTAIAYARYHQDGGENGRPPQRQIFVQPDEPTQVRMEQLLENGYQRSVNMLGGTPDGAA
jgi:phage gpG-like protein